MPGVISGTLGVDSAITDVFRLPVGIYAHLRLCCPGVNFSNVPDTGGPYYLWTTKAPDGTDYLTRWSYSLLADGTNHNIILDLPLSPLPGVGASVLTAQQFFSPSNVVSGYKTSTYLGGGALYKDGTYANPTFQDVYMGLGELTLNGHNATSDTAEFTPDMVGKPLVTMTTPTSTIITGYMTSKWVTVADAFVLTTGLTGWSVGGGVDVSGIAGLTGGSGTGPDDFDLGYSQAWYIGAEAAPDPGPTAPPVLPLTGVGNGGMFRTSFIQPDNEREVFVNGYDLNKVFWARTGAPYYLGLPIPGIPTCALVAGATAKNTGAFNYRVRWVNSVRNVISLPSDFKATAQDAADAMHCWRVTQPDVPANWAITHWIVERTTQSGGVYYPLNRDKDNLYGTPIAKKFFDDVVTDDDGFTQRIVLPTNQAQARPFVFGCANQGRLFLGGAIVMSLSGVIGTDGSKTITGLSAMTQAMVGWSISFGYQAQNTQADGDVNRYTIAKVVTATEIQLERNLDKSTIVYGPGGMVPVTLFAFISDAQNRGSWSELDCPEYFGAANFLGNSNEIFIGDAEPLTGVIGLGSISGTNLVLWTKKTQCYLHSYGPDPGFEVGGKVVHLPVRRGALNCRCLCYAGGVVYGMDQYGLWAYSPGQIPQEIGVSVRGLWQMEGLDFSKSDYFWIQHRPEDRTVVFFVVEAGYSRPRFGLVYDPDIGKFYVERHGCAGRTCGMLLPDKDGLVRAHSYAEKVGAEVAYLAAHGIGKADGIQWNNSMAFTNSPSFISSLRSAVLPSVGGFNWETGDLNSVPLTIRRNGAIFHQTIIASNEGGNVTLATDAPSTLLTTDVWEIGGINWLVRTGRSDAEAPDRKKNLRTAVLKLREKLIGPLLPANVGVYLNGSRTLLADNSIALNENGIVRAVNAGVATVTPSAMQRYQVPLNGPECTDFQVELSGSGVGAPVEILAPVRVVLDVDNDIEPRR